MDNPDNFICKSYRRHFSVKNKSSDKYQNSYLKEVPTRFELVIEVLQTFALPLGYGTVSGNPMETFRFTLFAFIY